jgi:hypothetical protein
MTEGCACRRLENDPMRDGIAMPWGVIPPPNVPGASGAFFNSPVRLWEGHHDTFHHLFCASASRKVAKEPGGGAL